MDKRTPSTNGTSSTFYPPLVYVVTKPWAAPIEPGPAEKAGVQLMLLHLPLSIRHLGMSSTFALPLLGLFYRTQQCSYMHRRWIWESVTLLRWLLFKKGMFRFLVNTSFSDLHVCLENKSLVWICWMMKARKGTVSNSVTPSFSVRMDGLDLMVG